MRVEELQLFPRKQLYLFLPEIKAESEGCHQYALIQSKTLPNEEIKIFMLHSNSVGNLYELSEVKLW